MSTFAALPPFAVTFLPEELSATSVEAVPAPVAEVTGGGAASGAWRVLVVGAGLIGTSVGAALVERGHRVAFEDLDRARAAAAAAAVARAESPIALAEFDIVVVAVPPAITAIELIRLARLYPRSTVMDTCSVKAEPQAEVEASGQFANVVLSHPLAGSAAAGPDGASATLFRGRSWALCATAGSTEAHCRRAHALVLECGAVPHWLSAVRHDEVVAATSHVPQLVASTLAASIAPLGEAARTLSGPALAEMTRVADSPSELWSQIALANAPAVAAALDVVIDELIAVGSALKSADGAQITRVVSALLTAGRSGRRLLGVKHAPASGSLSAFPDVAWSWVEVQVPDRRGGLAAVFAIAAEQEINIEDVRIDHAPHAAAGTVAIAVPREHADRLRDAIARASHDGVVGPA